MPSYLVMRIACVQMDIVSGDPTANAAHVVSHLAAFKEQGVNLAVFPECALTGYGFETRMDAVAAAIPSSHAELKGIQAAVDESGVGAVVGFAESRAGNLFNTAALFLPGEVPQYYRKTHLPEMGLDKYVTAGDRLEVFDTPWGRVGILICFDLRHPEAARALMLQGADVIVLPTNWPTGTMVAALVLAPARAVENKIFFASANRIGTEGGFTFAGKSAILDPFGNTLASAEAEESVLIADLDFTISRNKRNVAKQGVHETTILESRRPELYALLTR